MRAPARKARSGTVPREGATEQSLARLMVGREVVLQVDKEPAESGRHTPGGRRSSTVEDDRGLPAVRGGELQRACRRDRGCRRGRRERTDGSSSKH